MIGKICRGTIKNLESVKTHENRATVKCTWGENNLRDSQQFITPFYLIVLQILLVLVSFDAVNSILRHGSK